MTGSRRSAKESSKSTSRISKPRAISAATRSKRLEMSVPSEFAEMDVESESESIGSSRFPQGSSEDPFGSDLLLTEINGGQEFGLGAEADAPIRAENRLAIFPAETNYTMAAKLALAFSYCKFISTSADLFDCCLYLIVYFELHAVKRYGGSDEYNFVDSDVVVRTNPREGPFYNTMRARIDKVQKTLVDPSAINIANTLMYSTKVNWYLTNHHVGTKVVTGYVKRVMSQFVGEESFADKMIVEDLHRVGHFISTKMCFIRWFPEKDFYLPPGVDKDELPNVPVPSDDAMMRLKSFPAGTAKVSFVHSALTRAANSVYAMVMTDKGEGMAFRALYNSIKQDPFSYHIGAYYLTGRPRNANLNVSEYLQAIASVYVSVVLGNTTLSKASVKMPYHEAKSYAETMVSSLTQISRALSQTTYPSDDIIMAVLGMSGLTEGGGLSGFADSKTSMNFEEAINRGKKRAAEDSGLMERIKKTRVVSNETMAITDS